MCEKPSLCIFCYSVYILLLLITVIYISNNSFV